MADTTTNLPGFSGGGALGNLSNLHIIRQVGILIGIAASVALGIMVVIWLKEPLMRPLGQVDKQQAMDVIAQLEQQKIPYRLEPDGTIMVPQDDFQRVQIQLNSQGVELGTSQIDGFLAKDSGFSVSQRLEQARLLRSQELKLARTIERFSGVRAAEVHLAIPKDAVFVRDSERPSASVLLNLTSSRSLEPEQIRAMVDLVSGSVPNLDAARVTITDQFGRLHHSGSMSKDEVESSKEFAESRKRSETLQKKVERLLEPILGAGKYTVEVHVDMDFSQSEFTQKVHNPELAVVRSERTLNENNGEGGAQGIPGALSNQPPTPANSPEVAAAAGQASAQGSNRTRTEAERNYEVDTTISHTRNQIGTVRRITASVGLDYVETPTTTAGQEPSKGPRAEADIQNIAKLVKNAIGYDAQRGDLFEIQSFSFVRADVPEQPSEIPFWELPLFQMLIKPAMALLVALAFIFGVLSPVMKRLSAAPPPAAPGGDGFPMIDGLSSDRLSLSGADNLSLPPPVSTELDSVARAKAVVQSDPQLVAQVVKNWMEEDA